MTRRNAWLEEELKKTQRALSEAIEARTVWMGAARKAQRERDETREAAKAVVDGWDRWAPFGLPTDEIYALRKLLSGYEAKP